VQYDAREEKLSWMWVSILERGLLMALLDVFSILTLPSRTAPVNPK
jgi:hypothetical protein